MTKKELATKVVAACHGTQAHGITAGAVEDVITATLGVIKDTVYCGVWRRSNPTRLWHFRTQEPKSQDRPEHQHRRTRPRSGPRRRQF